MVGRAVGLVVGAVVGGAVGLVLGAVVGRAVGFVVEGAALGDPVGM